MVKILYRNSISFLSTFRFSTMEANVDHNNSSKAKMMVDFKYFIKSATEKKLPWNTLACFLTDLAPTLDKSKEIIRILVQELEIWVSKAEIETGNDKMDAFENCNLNEEQENNSNVSENYDFVENFDMYLDNETQAIELRQNIEDSRENENHENKAFQASNKVKILEETKIFNSKKDRNATKCDICLRFFKTTQTLLIHQRTHTGEKPHKCIMCKMAFAQSSTLKKHVRTHTREKQYECKKCHKHFSQSSYLKAHEKIHTGKRNFECDICHRSFMAKQSLQRHQAFHKGERPYHCKFCTKKFSQLHNLKVHERRRHTSEKPYKCSKCKKAFTQSCDLKNHQRTHTGEKPFQCKVCEKTFSIISNLKAHQRKFHSH